MEEIVTQLRLREIYRTVMFLLLVLAAPALMPGQDNATKKNSIGFHGGVTFPVGNLGKLSGNLGTLYKISHMFGIDYGYHFTPQLSAVAFLGYNHFTPKSEAAAYRLINIHWKNLSANLKWELSTKPLRPYVIGGFGFYISDAGPTKPGFNVGVGIDQRLNQRMVFEVGIDYHHILTSWTDPIFYTGHIGLIFRF